MASSTLRSQIFERKKNGENLSTTSLNQAQNEAFCLFLEFGLYFFFEIAYNNSLRECLKPSSTKTHGKDFGGPRLGQMG